jgi:uncharacterized membrane protein
MSADKPNAVRLFFDFMHGRWMATTLSLSGLGALIITMLMNRHAGSNMGATEEGRVLLSAGAIAVDVVGVCVFGLAAGVLANTAGIKSKIMAGFFGLLVVFSVVLSVQSIFNFISSERVSVDKARNARAADIKRRQKLSEDIIREREKARLEAAEKSRQAQVQLAEQHLRFMQQTIKKDDLSRKEKRDFVQGAGDVIAKMRPVETEAPKAETAPVIAEEATPILTEGGTEELAALLGGEASGWRVGQMAQLSVLLILYKAFAFSGAGLTWRRGPSPLQLAATVRLAAVPLQAAPQTIDAKAVEVPARPALPPPRTVNRPPPGKPVATAPGIQANPFIASRPLPGWDGELRSLLFPIDGRPNGPRRPALDPRSAAHAFARGMRAWGFVQTPLILERVHELYAFWCEADHRAPCAMNLIEDELRNMRRKGVVFAKRRLTPGSPSKRRCYVFGPGKPTVPSDAGAGAVLKFPTRA